MPPKRLYISALWLVEGNLKRSPEHYFRHLEPTLKMIRGGSLMFFYESAEILSRVTAVAEKYEINFLPQKLSLEDHPEFFHWINPTRTWSHKVIGKIIWKLRLTSFISRALN